jgi:site-specific recombinase
MNYAIGFIIIYLMGFTLATKQPAMTAVTLAQAIDAKNEKHDYTSFSELFTRLFRSQFIAFVGNVFMAFPFALILGYLWVEYFGYNPIKTYKAEKLLFEVNPFLSLALFHAAIAGFYLFLSGLISGYYMNNNVHYKISYRFKKHPVLKSIFPEKVLNAIANFYDKNIGGISGNFWFGVFLGTTGMVGYFIGLPIDIRHIAFSAGNFALALIGLEFTISFWDVLVSILCIGFIGFFNFIVSFMLSLLLAMRSRKIPILNIKYMLIAVWEAFLLNPKYFFLPPNESVTEDNRDFESVKDLKENNSNDKSQLNHDEEIDEQNKSKNE